MTDAVPPTDDPAGDDLLRQALHADAAGVTAGPELLDRIHGAAAGAATHSSRRTRLVLVAAAIVAVIAISITTALLAA